MIKYFLKVFLRLFKDYSVHTVVKKSWLIWKKKLNQRPSPWIWWYLPTLVLKTGRIIGKEAPKDLMWILHNCDRPWSKGDNMFGSVCPSICRLSNFWTAWCVGDVHWKSTMTHGIQSKISVCLLSPPVLIHGGLLYVAFCPSVCLSVCPSVCLSVPKY